MNANNDEVKQHWISVDDRLPDEFKNVLLSLTTRKGWKPISCIGFYSVEQEVAPCFILDDKSTILKGVTHWMPLPAPPAQGDKS